MIRSIFVSLSTAALLAVAALPAAADKPAGKIRFNRDIRPILSDKCFFCHGPDGEERQADLRLDVEENAKEYAIVPGEPEESEVALRISSDDDDVRMPPAESGKTLSAEEIALITRWIQEGAKYEPHWSFTPPRRPAVPPVKNAAWPRGEIDRFLLARLEEEKLSPSPPADNAALARRLYFDLLGLPPTAAEADEIAAAADDAAYEAIVDRLLDSPHYGERMAMYWLDLVRYANTVGYHGDQEHAITPYRDWVIEAFNGNLPFDRFTTEQLAGDLLESPTTEQIIATGYNRVLQTSHEGGVQAKEYLAKYAADRVRNVSGVWMGATMGCAECHDHKFDPYTQKDFYSLAAFFADVDEMRTFKGGDTTPTRREPEMEVVSPLDRRRIERLEAEIGALAAEEDGKHADRIAAIRKEITRLEKSKRRTMITLSVEPRTMRVLHRGDWMDETGEVVEPAVPHFLPQPPAEPGRRLTRLDLARWLTSPDNPQTARVFVNRLWYLFFGEGLSPSLDDTGSQGQWPTHPQLLNWLAVEFVESGWDVKHMVRLMVTSSAYRQSSQVSAELRERDPRNLLFARQGRFRLPAEVIRDNALAVSGLLVDELGGGLSRPYQPAGYYSHLNFPKRDYTADTDDGQYRRGVYVHWQRQFLHPMLRAFDAPTREECTARRAISNTPLAALTLLNDPTFVEAARVFAERILKEGGKSDEARVDWAWRQALSRDPGEGERDVLLQYLSVQRARYEEQPAAADKLLAIGLAPRDEQIPPAELAAWTSVARAIFNLNETITRN